jgi:catechol 2,3-dioxygenase-like lactoylglutathione lyase family enzyme
MSTTTRVSKLASVILPVADQDRQLEFYTEVLGLEKRADIPYGPGRWIEVAPSEAETPIALCPPGPDGAVGGKETGISLQVEDVETYHAQLKARDVDVDADISRFGAVVPPLFWFRDPEGNRLMVVEGA